MKLRGIPHLPAANPISIYLLLTGGRAFFFCLIFTVSMIYQATVAGLSPLQMVLVGTTLEVTCFLFEIPTGIVADLYSRRLSIIIGFALIGCGFLLEGSVPHFWAILASQVIWGIGFTFTSGATEAWITDEVGEESVGPVFLRGTQMDLAGGIPGLAAAALLGLVAVQLPIIVAGLGMLALSVVFVLRMPERHMRRTPTEQRTTFGHMKANFVEGMHLARQRAIVRTLILVSLVAGVAGEGFSRLGNVYLIEDVEFPRLFRTNSPVVWFAILGIGTTIAELVASEAFKRLRPAAFGTGNPARLMAIFASVQTLAMVSFALFGNVWVAMGMRLVRSVAVTLIKPVELAWLNRNLDSDSRATVLSIRGQFNSLGAVAGGPPIGWVGSTFSVRTAVIVSGLMMTPVIALYRRMISK